MQRVIQSSGHFARSLQSLGKGYSQIAPGPGPAPPHLKPAFLEGLILDS